MHIGHHRLDLPGIGGEGVIIKRDEAVGDFFIGKAQVVVGPVARVEQVARTHIPLVIGKAGENFQIPADLPGNIADAVGNPRRHADDIIGHQPAGEQRVGHAAGKNRAVGAAF